MVVFFSGADSIPTHLARQNGVSHVERLPRAHRAAIRACVNHSKDVLRNKATAKPPRDALVGVGISTQQLNPRLTVNETCTFSNCSRVARGLFWGNPRTLPSLLAHTSLHRLRMILGSGVDR